jgi:hypothetical protein
MKSFINAATLAAVAVSTYLLASASPAAAQNVALGKPVIDGNGSWNGAAPGIAPFNGGSFPAGHVTDGVTVEAPDAAISYWLGPEGVTNSYFTLDLGDSVHIDQVNLANTHNRQFNDFGATSVDGTNQLVNPFLLLSSALPAVTGESPIAPQTFTSANGLIPADARYLRFETSTSTYGNGNVGLNEIEVFDLTAVNPNIAFGKPVVDASGSYPDSISPLPGYAPPKITDGSISDASGINFWLGREGVPQEHVTIDLGSTQHIAEILLRNTHNAEHADRGTKDFRVLVGNSLDGSNQIVNPVQILQGQLRNKAGQSIIEPDVFTSANGLIPTDARYIRFEALSPTYAETNNIGLNEMEVFSTELHPPTEFRDNVALNKPVIKDSGAWNGQDPNGVGASPFPASRVTDGSSADSNGTRSSYWLGRELQTDQNFTVDLQGIYRVDEIDLRNAHNTQFNDRGTGEFFILGATAVDANNELIDPVFILAGRLTNTSGQEIITPDVFTVANGLNVADVRYLRFEASTYVDSTNGFGGVGLNEIEVYGTLVPEPASIVLMAIAGVIVGWRRLRRR